MKTRISAATNPSKGFLLITLLIMIAVMSIGLLRISLRYRQEVEREKEAELIQIGHEYRDAVKRYYFYHNRHRYPQSTEDLLRNKHFPETVRFLRRAYRDPITGKPLKEIKIGPIFVGVYSTSKAQPLKRTHFIADDADFTDSDQLQYWTFTYPPHLLKVLPRNHIQKQALDKRVNPSG